MTQCKKEKCRSLDRIRVVLVGTTHPGNIGGAARAMKAMGLRRLYLVRPERFPCAEATARASGADDLLAGAVVCETLAKAVADCHLVIGTTARERRLPWPVLDPRACGELALTHADAGEEVALVFGREHSGLTNEELALCQRAIRIPTDPDFSSLNLAAAVQVLCYELRMAAGAPQRREAAGRQERRVPPATRQELDALHRHLLAAMTAVGFLDPDKPRQLPRRLARLLVRAGLDHNEVQILRGFLAAVEQTAERGRGA
ncbi:MAG: RNA methyltransferase [Gammaproteobacteria bacterium]|nr:MAG: RNA methyltransferase [Gammaproteobacteria bacterium]